MPAATALLGLVLIVYGVSLWSLPAALVVAGLALVRAAAVLDASRGDAK